MVLLLNTTETGERQRNIRKEAKAIPFSQTKKKKNKRIAAESKGASRSITWQTLL
jgi:hypothetical protein